MWICLNKSFLSIVADRNKKDRLLVRARVKGHIEAVFPEAEIFTDVGADYHFRAFIDRATVAKVIADEVDDIDYPNFKGSVKSKALHDAYMGFWTIMFHLQERLLNAVEKPKAEKKAKFVRVTREHLPMD